MMKDNSEELLPLVDDSGQVIGSATRGECHNGSHLLHPVVHIHVFNREGSLYLQKRPEWKDVQPGRWDTSVGGHIDYGETVDAALRREAREELGLSSNLQLVPMASYVYESAVESEYINAYKTVVDVAPQPSAELDGGKFWTKSEIKAALGTGVFTPNFESEYKRFFL